MLRLAPAALALLVAAETPDPTSKAIEYGIIGILLVTFIVWSRKDKEKSDTKWEATNAQMFEIVTKQTAALTQSTEALNAQTDALNELNRELRGRPCMIPERRK